MSVEHHRDLAHEFPELKQRIHDLKEESAEFRRLYTAYQELDNEVYRIEQEIETPSDAYTEDLKWRRLRLKDRLYGLLTGHLHMPPATEEFVIRGKFPAPVERDAVCGDWGPRGFACSEVTAPSGIVRRDQQYEQDALMTVMDGRLDVQMHDVDYVLELGDEMFIPRGVPFTLLNTGVGEARCLLGLD
jgi:uncharacterized protein YdcH (DUF465 family)/mannose-6-phosphate isomerase-like protein (cupin superfamily)